MAASADDTSADGTSAPPGVTPNQTLKESTTRRQRPVQRSRRERQRSEAGRQRAHDAPAKQTIEQTTRDGGSNAPAGGSRHQRTGSAEPESIAKPKAESRKPKAKHSADSIEPTATPGTESRKPKAENTALAATSASKRPKERQRMIPTTSSPRTAARAPRSPARECAAPRTGVLVRPVAAAPVGGTHSSRAVAPALGGSIREHSRSRRACSRARAGSTSPVGVVLRDSTPFLVSSPGSCRASPRRGSAGVAGSPGVSGPATSRLARRPWCPTPSLARDGSSVAPPTSLPALGS
jgi:hypothetical protein